MSRQKMNMTPCWSSLLRGQRWTKNLSLTTLAQRKYRRQISHSLAVALNRATIKLIIPRFFMQRGYQVLLVLGLIAAFFLVMVYQTLFGRIEQPQQMVTIESGQTYYGLLPQWQQQIPLFSATIAKLYMKTQIDGPLHAGIYQLPENPTFAEALEVLGQGVKAAMVKVQIIEGKTSKDLYQALRDNKGIKKEVLTADSTNASIAQ